MTLDRGGVEVFDRDAATHAGYRYTTGATLSSRLATQRSIDVVLAMGRFPGRTLLDVGCGDGFYTVRVWDAGRPRALVAVDAAHRALAVARQKAGKRPIRFAVGDAHHLPFPDRSFELVLVQSILHHDDAPLDLIREAFRLAPEVLIHEPNGNNPGLKIIERVSRYHRDHGEKSYTSRRLVRWVEEAGGEVVARRFAGFVPMFCPDWMARATKRLEPIVEGLPVLRALASAVTVIVARHRAAR